MPRDCVHPIIGELDIVLLIAYNTRDLLNKPILHLHS